MPAPLEFSGSQERGNSSSQLENSSSQEHIDNATKQSISAFCLTETYDGDVLFARVFIAETREQVLRHIIATPDSLSGFGGDTFIDIHDLISLYIDGVNNNGYPQSFAEFTPADLESLLHMSASGERIAGYDLSEVDVEIVASTQNAVSQNS